MIPSKCLTTQHRLLVMDVEIKSLRRKKRKIVDSRAKWWNPTSEHAAKLVEKVKAEGNWNLAGDADTLWGGMVECIRKSTTDVFGVSKGGRGE